MCLLTHAARNPLIPTRTGNSRVICAGGMEFPFDPPFPDNDSLRGTFEVSC